MLSSGHIRVTLAIAQILTTMGALVGGSVGVAVAQDRQAVARAEAALQLSNRHFQATLASSLGDGTPPGMLDPITAEASRVLSSQRARTFVVDRLVIADLEGRAGAMVHLSDRVRRIQQGVEQDLLSQLQVALGTLKEQLAAARQVGASNADELEKRGAAYATWATQAVIPKEGVQRLHEVGVLNTLVRDATAAKVAADDAAHQEAAAAAAAVAEAAAATLQAASDDFGYQRQRAHTALAEAQAIPVLRVADAAAAIARLDGRPVPQAAADLEELAGAYASLAHTLQDLVYIRRTTYAQLAAARSADGRAASMGVDVGGFTARLDAASRELDAAGDVASILAAADSIQGVRTAIDGAISYARAHPPPPPGAVVLNVPYFAQIYSLSCEAASLQMALAYQGIHTDQDAILGTIGVDRRAPEVDGAGNVVHWGDPYAAFVGDPNGYREGAQYGDRSGYGVYHTAISRAATALGGKVVRSDERIAPGDLYQAVNQRHPSVVWVAWQYSPHGTTTYQAWDGRVVMYGAPWEHAVTLVGVANDSVLINNPHGGQEWIPKGTFEAAYGMFNQMATILN